MTADAARSLEREGRVWLRGGLSEKQLAALDTVSAMSDAPGMRLDATAAAGALAPVNQIAAGLLAGALPVRLVAFNKSDRVNWSLPWHQDRVIAVRERAEVAGFGNWTRKAGVWHVEPPIDVLERMFFARVHLDAATIENGCMEIAVGSHGCRRVPEARVEAMAMRSDLKREYCVAERGDVLFVKALTLHRSRASQATGNRRALRIDYAAGALPPPLEWEFSS